MSWYSRKLARSSYRGAAQLVSSPTDKRPAMLLPSAGRPRKLQMEYGHVGGQRRERKVKKEVPALFLRCGIDSI